MAHVPKKNQLTDLSPLRKTPIEVPPISDISVARLIDDGLLVLYREIKNLLMMSVNGKLEPNDARDLRDHLKLLFELKDRESESLRGLTDEQLKEQAKAVLNEEKKD
jgi:hypothetical protein